jgi:hypothetical protein
MGFSTIVPQFGQCTVTHDHQYRTGADMKPHARHMIVALVVALIFLLIATVVSRALAA